MIQNPPIRHSYVEVHSTLVHIVQYGLDQSLLKPPNGSLNISTSVSPTPTDKNVQSRVSTGNNERPGTASSSKKTAKQLIVFIPGNPGILGMYHDFLMALFSTLNVPHGDESHPILPILAISHNNFDHPDHVDYQADARYYIGEDELNFAEKAQANNYQADPHQIELQVLNKLIILKRLLKENLEDFQITFVGHSIGCYVILKLLQDRLLTSVHAGSILLHPALENLALTGKGAKFDRLFSYKLDLVLRAAALVMEKLLPKPLKLSIAKWKCTRKYLEYSSEIAIESLYQLVCSKSLEATIKMAKSEFSSIKDIDVDTLIKPHTSKLKLVYAINDHWVNTEHRRRMKKICPDLYMEEQPVLHAFIMDPETVMEYSVKVALFVRDFINKI